VPQVVQHQRLGHKMAGESGWMGRQTANTSESKCAQGAVLPICSPRSRNGPSTKIID
jgi:hypothetical protein